MPIAIDPERTFDHVLQCDQKRPCGCAGRKKECLECKGTGTKDVPCDKQTVFQLKVLKGRELAELEDNLSTVSVDGQIKIAAGSQVLRILEMGLIGWKNFKTKEGADVPFRKDGVINWDCLRQDWRRELANMITEQTRLGEKELKNLKLGQESSLES